MYKELPKPIPVEFLDNVIGYGKGHAIGVKTTPVADGKIAICYMVRLDNGDPCLVSARYILPKS